MQTPIQKNRQEINVSIQPIYPWWKHGKHSASKKLLVEYEALLAIQFKKKQTDFWYHREVDNIEDITFVFIF